MFAQRLVAVSSHRGLPPSSSSRHLAANQLHKNTAERGGLGASSSFRGVLVGTSPASSSTREPEPRGLLPPPTPTRRWFTSSSSPPEGAAAAASTCSGASGLAGEHSPRPSATNPPSTTHEQDRNDPPLETMGTTQTAAAQQVVLPKRRLLSPHHVPAPLPIPDHVPKPSYASAPPKFAPPELPDELYGETKNPKEIAAMRKAADIAARSLVVAEKLIKARSASGDPLTTSEIDHCVQQFVMDSDAYPVGVRFHGFPRAICTSVNEVVVHGVPDNRVLEDGDIINCDVSTFVDGHYGDNSKMFAYGVMGEEAERWGDFALGAGDCGWIWGGESSLYERVEPILQV